MRVVTAALVFAGSLALPQAAAFAACDLRVESPGQVRFTGEDGRGYDSFAGSRGEVEFMVTIENRDTSNACNGLVSVQRDAADKGLEGGTGSDLAYRIARPANLATIVDVQTEGGRPPNAIPISIAPGATITQRLALSVPPRQIVPSGRYSEDVLLRVLDTSDLSVISERSLQLTTNVQAQASVLLYDGSIVSPTTADAGTRNRQLDFHSLETGEEASLTVLVQSNDNYSVRFTSANRGALAHAEIGPSQTVGYSLFFGGQQIGLESGEANVNARPATGIAGAALPLRIRIGAIGAAHAGRYEDQLTISIVPD
jgi:hypothetical protein